MQHPTSSRRLRRSLAALIAMGLIAPSAVAVAKPSTSSTDSQPNAVSEAPGRSPLSRPAAQVDKVYRGSLDGALGVHTWSGDVFGTGTITTLSYEIALDDLGVPTITNVSVDESSLPEGATAEVRGSSNQTSLPEPAEEPVEAPVEIAATVDDDTTSTTKETTSTAEETTSTTEDTTSTTTVDDEVPATVTFAARNGVKFTLGERWAGLLLLAHGRLGDEPVIAVRSILVSPPAEGRDVSTTTTTSMAGDEKDRGDDRVRGDDRSRDDKDRSTRELARGDRPDDIRSDHQKRDEQRKDDRRPDARNERPERGGDRPPTSP